MPARAAGVGRRHRLLDHTADVGLEAEGPDLPAAFVEAALALAELTAEPGPAGDAEGGASEATAPISLEAADLVGLAYAWLNELVGRIDVDGALTSVAVERVGADPAGGGWHLVGRVATRPFDDRRVRRRHDVKSATLHGLTVEPSLDGWRLVAILDI